MDPPIKPDRILDGPAPFSEGAAAAIELRSTSHVDLIILNVIDGRSSPARPEGVAAAAYRIDGTSKLSPSLGHGRARRVGGFVYEPAPRGTSTLLDGCCECS